MWGLRRQVSLLLGNGHPAAAHYPIGMLYDEAELVRSRVDQQLAAIGVVVQAATMTTGFGASKESYETFTGLISKLNRE